eukprot:5351340-Prymnesium_polylepis.2
MATPVITYPHWEQSQSAWISPGERLQIPVPMAKKGRLLHVEFDVSRAPPTTVIPASAVLRAWCRGMDALPYASSTAGPSLCAGHQGS